MNYSVLTAEVNQDPLNRGYGVLTDREVADSLNDIIDRVVPVESVGGHEIFEAIVPADYGELTGTQRDLLHAIVGMAIVPVQGNVANALGSMFAGSDTLDALVALKTQPTSRGVELGLGVVGDGHIKSARAV